MNLYNDIDEKACAWTQELINAGEIPAGKVLCKSITEITPDDLKGFTQVHYFNGISGWAYALKLAGWEPTRPVWCASLPCQPFSVAGAGKGTDDERHLWPVFLELVKACQPEIIFGEQVASADVLGSSGKKADEKSGVAWFDGICADLEEASYTVGAVDLPSAGIGSPNIRQRLYWCAHRMADTQDANGRRGECGEEAGTRENGIGRRRSAISGATLGLADKQGRGQRIDGSTQGSTGHADELEQAGRLAHAISGREKRGLGAGGEQVGEQENGPSATNESGDRRDQSPCGVADASGERRQQESRCASGDEAAHGREGRDRIKPNGDNQPASDGQNPWSRSILIPCRDGKTRRIPESGIFPLVDGFSNKLVPGGDPSEAEADASGEDRTTRLRGYGNAINPHLAAEFIMAAMG